MRAFRFSLTFVILASLSFLLLLTWFLVTLISFKTAERDLLEQRRESARFLLRGVATVLGPEPSHPSEGTDRLLDALA
ncbi:MAG TPA: hypothetical protein VFR01_01125, partial [Geobacterales bacterium]|nr:hypothetical protein [Geobacterales bacterium]